MPATPRTAPRRDADQGPRVSANHRVGHWSSVISVKVGHDGTGGDNLAPRGGIGDVGGRWHGLTTTLQQPLTYRVSARRGRAKYSLPKPSRPASSPTFRRTSASGGTTILRASLLALPGSSSSHDRACRT